jgi:hypothetical protein
MAGAARTKRSLSGCEQKWRTEGREALVESSVGIGIKMKMVEEQKRVLN